MDYKRGNSSESHIAITVPIVLAIFKLKNNSNFVLSFWMKMLLETVIQFTQNDRKRKVSLSHATVFVLCSCVFFFVFFFVWRRISAVRTCYRLCDGTSKIALAAESWIYHQNILNCMYIWYLWSMDWNISLHWMAGIHFHSIWMAVFEVCHVSMSLNWNIVYRITALISFSLCVIKCAEINRI